MKPPPPILPILLFFLPSITPLSHNINRRTALQHAATATTTISLTPFILPQSTHAAATTTTTTKPKPPPPRLYVPPSKIIIPRVGYSLYKTPPSQASKCTSLALQAGIRHFDVATLYNSNTEVGDSLKTFLQTGRMGEETTTTKDSSPETTTPAKRRQELFLHHKLRNEEQSIDKTAVKDAVKKELSKLKVDYLDMCSVHSPLTDQQRRLATYEALLELKQEGLVKSVGVCNYGVKVLDEIVTAGLSPPSSIQLELSPFHQHRDIQAWASNHGSVLNCAAWSKLSGVTGPQEGWVTVANMANAKKVTKAQILVRWSLQKGFICVPRSGSGSKLERIAIFENSYNGVQEFTLSLRDMKALDGLEENLRAGKLGRRDGWNDEDVMGDDWDPTDFV